MTGPRFHLIQFKLSDGKKLSQCTECRECVFKQKRFQFVLENVEVSVLVIGHSCGMQY